MANEGNEPVIVSCCHCGARFDERLIGGTFLDRNCPSCRKSISEEDYDELANRLLESAREAARIANGMYPRLKDLEECAALFNKQIGLINQRHKELKEGIPEWIPERIIPEEKERVLMLSIPSQVSVGIRASGRSGPSGAMLQAFRHALEEAETEADQPPLEISSSLLEGIESMALEDEEEAGPVPFEVEDDEDEGEEGPAPPEYPAVMAKSDMQEHDDETSGRDGDTLPNREAAQGGETARGALRPSPASPHPDTGKEQDDAPEAQAKPMRPTPKPLRSSIGSRISLEALEALVDISREAAAGQTADAAEEAKFSEIERDRKRKHDLEFEQALGQMKAREEERQQGEKDQERLARKQKNKRRKARRSQEKLREHLLHELEQEKAREQIEFELNHPEQARLMRVLAEERERNHNKEAHLQNKLDRLKRKLRDLSEEHEKLLRKTEIDLEEARLQHEFELEAVKRRASHDIQSAKRACNREIELAHRRARVERNEIRRQAEEDKATICGRAEARIEASDEAHRASLLTLRDKLEEGLDALEQDYGKRLDDLESELAAERSRRILAEGATSRDTGEEDALVRRQAILKAEAHAIRMEAGELRSRIDALGDQEREIRKQIADVARNRYYISEWFRMTRSPLQDRDTYGNEFSLTPCYNPESGLFTLSIDDGRTTSVLRGRGQYGEFTVFEWLRRKAADPQSALCGALALPNLVFSWDEGGAGSHTHWAQVDCLLMTRRLAAFIEVKHWNCSIETHAPFETVAVSNGSLREFDDAERSFTQAKRAKSALSRITDRYDESRVLDMTVFVDPTSFRSDSDVFCGTTFVGWCDSTHQNFIDALCAKESSLRPVLSEKDLTALAREMFDAANDKHGRRSIARKHLATGHVEQFLALQEHDDRFGWIERAN